MPIRMSRWGFRASWAAVLTASEAVYAKKIRPAPRNTPLQPNRRSAGVGGLKRLQLSD